MFSSKDRRGGRIPSWLHKQGISYFRGWIRHCEPALGPDYVMDWVFRVGEDEYVMHRDGDAGPFSPPPPADLQTFLDAVACMSRDMLLTAIDQMISPILGKEPRGTWLSDALKRGVDRDTLVREWAEALGREEGEWSPESEAEPAWQPEVSEPEGAEPERKRFTERHPGTLKHKKQERGPKLTRRREPG